MKFCPNCDSLIYYNEENDTLFETCEHCGFKEKCNQRLIASTNYTIKNLQMDEAKGYVRYDDALPRTIHKECPNKDCPSSKNKALQEAVYYPNKQTMKLVYVCVACNTQWQYS